MIIPRFSAGQQLTADSLNKLSDAIRSVRVTSFVGGRVEQNTGGTSLILTAQTGGGGGGTTEMLPFEVFLSPDPADPNDPTPRPLFEVNPVSYVWQQMGSIERVIITPFNIPGQYAKFFLPDAPGAIVVTFTFNETMVIANATLDQIPLSEWPDELGGPAGYPWPIERDLEATGANYLRQKKFYLVIAEVSTKEDERDGILVEDQGVMKKVIQMTKTHLLLDWRIIDGLAAKVPIPWQDQPQLTN